MIKMMMMLTMIKSYVRKLTHLIESFELAKLVCVNLVSSQPSPTCLFCCASPLSA